jgi:hypothetical protein
VNADADTTDLRDGATAAEAVPAGEPVPGAEPVIGTPEGDELEGTLETPGAEDRAGPTFDINAFVANLPDGVCLCPLCLGMGGVIEEPPFDPNTHMCVTCLGRGKVRTGSLKSDQAERDCRACDGNGWMPNDPNEPPAGPAHGADLAGELPPRDYAGRTPDDPDFDWSRVARVEVPAPAPPAEPAAV